MVLPFHQQVAACEADAAAGVNAAQSTCPLPRRPLPDDCRSQPADATTYAMDFVLQSTLPYIGPMFKVNPE